MSSADPAVGQPSCSALFKSVLSRERHADTAGAINAELDALGDRCPRRFQVFVDYVSIKDSAALGAAVRCSDFARHDVQAEAVKMARQDGYCSGPRVEKSEKATPRWTCVYSPTLNDDWHDDVSCSNGIHQRRPYLREWDRFVTKAELMQSAREYEQQLNAR